MKVSKMSNTYFKFKQFIIHQDKCSMKVGTDGVLMGAMASVEDGMKVLDIGTGTGLIALMMAQRADAIIDAVEIDADAAGQARHNVELSPWLGRINVHHASIMNYYVICDTKYSLIVSNPPFFSKAFTPPSAKRAIARHDESFTLSNLFTVARKLLLPQGKLEFILPVIRNDEVLRQAAEHGFTLIKRMDIIPKPGKQAIRYIYTFSMIPSALVLTSLIIEQEKRHQYSEAFIKVLQDFYLNF